MIYEQSTSKGYVNTIVKIAGACLRLVDQVDTVFNNHIMNIYPMTENQFLFQPSNNLTKVENIESIYLKFIVGRRKECTRNLAVNLISKIFFFLDTSCYLIYIYSETTTG